MGDVFGALAIVALNANAHPPITDGAREAKNSRGLVAMGQVVGEFVGSMFLFESANLDGPTATAIDWSGTGQDLDTDHCHAGSPEINFLSSGFG